MDAKHVVPALLFLALAVAIFPAASSAGSSGPAATPQAAAPASGARAEFLDNLDYYEQRFLRLAEAAPADKFAWRLNEGVRSLSEIYLHVAGANYNLSKLIGTQPPPGFDAAELQTSTTDKAVVIQTLKDSFVHVRA